MSTSETCTKCQGEKTGQHPRWCLVCRGNARRGNAGNAVTDGNEAARSNAGPTTTDSPRTRRREGAGRAHDHAACHAEIERLRLDQARLKVELSEARVASGALVLTGRPVGPTGSHVMRALSASAKSQNENKHTMTPHGRNCQGVCCKYGQPA